MPGLSTFTDGDIVYVVIYSRPLLHNASRGYLAVLHDLWKRAGSPSDFDAVALTRAVVGVFAFRNGTCVGFACASHEPRDTVGAAEESDGKCWYKFECLIKAETEAGDKRMDLWMANQVFYRCDALTLEGLESWMRANEPTDGSTQRFVCFGFDQVERDGGTMYQLECKIVSHSPDSALGYLPPVVIDRVPTAVSSEAPTLTPTTVYRVVKSCLTDRKVRLKEGTLVHISQTPNASKVFVRRLHTNDPLGRVPRTAVEEVPPAHGDVGAGVGGVTIAADATAAVTAVTTPPAAGGGAIGGTRAAGAAGTAVAVTTVAAGDAGVSTSIADTAVAGMAATDTPAAVGPRGGATGAGQSGRFGRFSTPTACLGGANPLLTRLPQRTNARSWVAPPERSRSWNDSWDVVTTPPSEPGSGQGVGAPAKKRRVCVDDKDAQIASLQAQVKELQAQVQKRALEDETSAKNTATDNDSSPKRARKHTHGPGKLFVRGCPGCQSPK
uniref:Uncharacterized protein n=1 Tax=Florenciella parvula TaxID=236787 RepID=A0A7S2GAF0_9STRA